MEAYEVTGERGYLDVALSSADFVMNDLHRAECRGGFLFSYSPLKGNDTVFNASLLLAHYYALAKGRFFDSWFNLSLAAWIALGLYNYLNL